MGLQLEECQVAKFNLMNSAIRPKSRRKICFGSFFFVKKRKKGKLTKTILIIEDEQNLHDLYGVMLEGAGCEIISCPSQKPVWQYLHIITSQFDTQKEAINAGRGITENQHSELLVTSSNKF